jgi:hypothetical protein
MRPLSVFANGPVCEVERLRGDLRGRWRLAVRAVMVLLSLHGLPAAEIAVLLECHPGHGAELDRPLQHPGGGGPGRPSPVREAPAGRGAADRADQRAAGSPGALDGAAAVALPGTTADEWAHAVPAGAAGCHLAAAQADRPGRSRPRPGGSRDRSPADPAAAPGGGVGRRRDQPAPAAAHPRQPALRGHRPQILPRAPTGGSQCWERWRSPPAPGPAGWAAAAPPTQLIGEGWAHVRKFFSLSEKYAPWADYHTSARAWPPRLRAHGPTADPAHRPGAYGLIRSGGTSAAKRAASPDAEVARRSPDRVRRGELRFLSGLGPAGGRLHRTGRGEPRAAGVAHVDGPGRARATTSPRVPGEGRPTAGVHQSSWNRAVCSGNGSSAT